MWYELYRVNNHQRVKWKVENYLNERFLMWLIILVHSGTVWYTGDKVLKYVRLVDERYALTIHWISLRRSCMQLWKSQRFKRRRYVWLSIVFNFFFFRKRRGKSSCFCFFHFCRFLFQLFHKQQTKMCW